MHCVVILLLLGLPQIQWTGSGKMAIPQAAADALVDSVGREYYDAKFAFYPGYATSRGVRGHDGDLSTFRRRDIGAFLRKISQIQKALDRFDQDSLSMESWIDSKALSADMATEVFLIEDLALPQRSPLLYSNSCIEGIYYLLMKPRSDPPAARRDLTSRVAAIPEVVTSARRNLTDPLRLHCEVASASIKDFLPLLEGLGSGSRPDSLRIDAETVDRSSRSLAGFAAYLDSLAPEAETDFSLGRENFATLLETRHMIHDSPEDLVAYAERVLAHAKAQRAGSPGIRPDVAADTARAYLLTNDDITAHLYAEIESARVFVIRNDLVTLPGEGTIEISQTPAFLRGLVPGYAYEPPGPFDDVQRGVLYVPLPTHMDPQTKLLYRQAMDRRRFRGPVVHEAFPGHHLQIVTANRHPSLIRRLQDNCFMMEGWALYCEELMATQGYSGPEGMTRALEGIIFRAARVIVDIRLQTRDFSLDEAADFMVNQTGADRHYVEKEVRRYAVQPTQAMSYLIGKRDILTLKDEVRSIMGDSFTLKRFHDNLLSCGSLPPYLLRTCVKNRSVEGL